MDEKINIEDLLASGQTIQIKPKGFSMYPLLFPDRDDVIISPIVNHRLKRGDVVLYRREGSILVWHRICKVKKDGYYMVGDNQREIEGPLNRQQIKGIMTAIIRKGKYITVSNAGYQLYSHIWLFLRPVRPIIGKSVAGIKRLFGGHKK